MNIALGRALIDKGLIPERCRLLEVVLSVDSAPVLRYEKLLTIEEVATLGAAMQESVGERKCCACCGEAYYGDGHKCAPGGWPNA